MEHGFNSPEFIGSAIESGLTIAKDYYWTKLTKFLDKHTNGIFGQISKPISDWIDERISDLSEYLGKQVHSRIQNLFNNNRDNDDNLPFIFGINGNNNLLGGKGRGGTGPKGKGKKPGKTSGAGKTGGIEFQIPKGIKGYKHFLFFKNSIEQNVIFNFRDSNIDEIIEVANRFIDSKVNNIKFNSLNQIFQTLLTEIYGGFIGYGVLPYVSLNFNNKGLLYSIMPRYYKKTIVGNILGFLDYFLKGFVNGGYFREDFVKTWYLNKNIDPNYLNKNFINLKKYIYRKKAKIKYHEFYATIYELGENITENNEDLYKNTLSAFRIIGIIDSDILVKDNKIMPTCYFVTESDFNMFEGYSNKKENVEETVEALKRMKVIIKNLMPQIPYFRSYFCILDMITFAIHYISTLDVNALYPNISNSLLIKSGFSSYATLLPPVFPPLPFRKQIIIEVNLKFSYSMDNFLNNDERNRLNSFLGNYILNQKEVDFRDIEDILAVLENKYRNYISNLITDKEELEIRSKKELHIDEFLTKIQEIFKILTQYPSTIFSKTFEELKKSLIHRMNDIKNFTKINYGIRTNNIENTDKINEKKIKLDSLIKEYQDFIYHTKSIMTKKFMEKYKKEEKKAFEIKMTGLNK